MYVWYGTHRHLFGCKKWRAFDPTSSPGEPHQSFSTHDGIAQQIEHQSFAFLLLSFLRYCTTSKKEIQTSSTHHYFVPVVLTGSDGPSSSCLSSLPHMGRPASSHDIGIVIVISRIERGISVFGTTRAAMPLIAQGLCAPVRVAPIQATKKTGA